MAEAQVVLITGAARRIGAAIARHFHQRGFQVLIHYHQSREAALGLAEELNGLLEDSARTLQANLISDQDVTRLGDMVLSEFGHLDVLVNNASAFYPTDFGSSTGQQWDELIGSNLRAAYFLSQSLRQTLSERRGAIINLVDTHADQPLQGYPIYSIAKAGLKAMTRSLAKELAPAVRVNGVSPGAILWPPALEDDDDPAVLETRGKILKQIPLGKLGSPDLIAAAVYFLACQAQYMTGQVLKVDGGRSLT